MKRFFKFLPVLLLIVPVVIFLSGKKPENKIRLLYWNIQMGMWDGQSDNYDRFVEWVKSKNPDICVWCEGASLLKTDSDATAPKSERYFPAGWPEVARRYGHDHVYVGGMRDPFPQIITSRFPIDTMGRFIGTSPDSIVVHGAGWAKVSAGDKDINIVTLHLQPYSYWRYLPDDQKEESSRNYGGEKYRRMELEWIFNHTVRTRENPENELWMVLGDFNSRSRRDNFYYKWSQASQDFLVHNYIEETEPWLYDVVAETFPGTFCPSHGKKRIDYVYVSRPLFKAVKNVVTEPDAFSKPKPTELKNMKRPSDHHPILVDFNLDRIK